MHLLIIIIILVTEKDDHLFKPSLQQQTQSEIEATLLINAAADHSSFHN